LQKRYALLTPREREVLPFVVTGMLSKQTAAGLGTSEITIRVHRGQIMRKMQAQSLVDCNGRSGSNAVRGIEVAPFHGLGHLVVVVDVFHEFPAQVG
jgi:DNA-binding NarL/FixJ family response regulator